MCLHDSVFTIHDAYECLELSMFKQRIRPIIQGLIPNGQISTRLFSGFILCITTSIQRKTSEEKTDAIVFRLTAGSNKVNKVWGMLTQSKCCIVDQLHWKKDCVMLCKQITDDKCTIWGTVTLFSRAPCVDKLIRCLFLEEPALDDLQIQAHNETRDRKW